MDVVYTPPEPTAGPTSSTEGTVTAVMRADLVDATSQASLVSSVEGGMTTTEGHTPYPPLSPYYQMIKEVCRGIPRDMSLPTASPSKRGAEGEVAADVTPKKTKNVAAPPPSSVNE